MASELISVKWVCESTLRSKSPCHPHERHPRRVRVPYWVTLLRMQFVTHWGTLVLAPTPVA
jgi:hypothetical protein